MTSTSKPKSIAKTAIVLPLSQNIPLNKICISPENVRTVDADDAKDIAALAASIAHRGLLQSLNVRPCIKNDKETGHYEIPAGGRRYRALKLLVAQKRIAADVLVPCVVKTTGLAVDDSLAENTDRKELHPLDEFRAYEAMKAAGMSEAAIAAAHRVTATYVKQRLRLASASPNVLNAYAQDRIDIDQLIAFCIVDNHDRQDAVLASILKHNQPGGPYYIKQLLTEDTIRLDDARAKFVGLKAYKAAGGTVLRDLFDTSDSSYLANPDILTRLLDTKFEAIRKHMIGQGWKWVTIAKSIPYAEKSAMHRLNPLPATLAQLNHIKKLEKQLEALIDGDNQSAKVKARITALEQEIDNLNDAPPKFKKADMAKAGVFISLTYNGQLAIDAGFINPADTAAAAKTDTTASTQTQPASDDAMDAIKSIPESLIQDLTAFRTIGLRNTLAQNYDIAFTAALHALILSHFYHQPFYSCLQITARQTFASQTPGLDTWPSTKAIDKRDAALRKLLPEDVKDLWPCLVAMADKDKKALFAHCVASSVNTVQCKAQLGHELEHGHALAATLGFTMPKAGWTTTAENYFSRISKQHILTAVTEAKGAAAASALSTLKRTAMASEAERLIATTNWVPPIIRQPEQPAVE